MKARDYLLKMCRATIIICISQLQLNFMDAKILLFSHLQIILGDNAHYFNATTGVKLVMVSRNKVVM